MSLREIFPLAYKDTIKWNMVARDKSPSIEEQEDIVAEEFAELEEALEEDDLKETLDALADIFFTAAYLEELDNSHHYVDKAVAVLVAAIKAFGHVAIEATIQEVVESNLTKFVSINKAPYAKDADARLSLIDSELDRLSLKHGLRMTCQQRGDYLIFIDDNNKIRKPFCYVAPNIAIVIDKFIFNEDPLNKFKESK